MIDEIKRYTTMYDQKLNFAVTETEITALLTDTELIIENCNQKLEDAGMSPCCYTPLDEKIARLQRDLDILKRYVQTTREYIYSKLDQPFQQNFSCNATETLSQIKISELETDNNIALQEYCEIYRQGYTHGYKKVKAKLKFSDFLTIEEVRPGDGTVVLEGMDTIQEFAVLFRPQYNKLMEDVQDISDCAEIILTQGEYNHAEYHPVGNLISSLLDITIVKPIVECFVGRDLITGEELEESQKAVKLAGAAVGLVTLGQSVLVAKGTGMAGKELLGVVGKTVLLDMASMAATYGMGYAGEQLRLPGEVTWILSVATGCTVSMVGGKLLFRDIDKGIIQECTTEDLAKIAGEKSGALDMTQVGKSVTAEEIDIYLQYKKEGSLYRFSREEREAIQRMQRMDIPDEELKKVLQVKQSIVIENVVNEGGSPTPIKYSPINPCDEISREVAESFSGATFTKRVLTEDTVMYRVSGGNAKEVGSYMSMTPQGGGLQSQLDLALNPAWGNTTENVTKIVVPKGTTIYEGIAAPQNIYDSLGNVIGTLPGGGSQVYIPKVEVGWFQ